MRQKQCRASHLTPAHRFSENIGIAAVIVAIIPDLTKRAIGILLVSLTLAGFPWAGAARASGEAGAVIMWGELEGGLFELPVWLRQYATEPPEEILRLQDAT